MFDEASHNQWFNMTVSYLKYIHHKYTNPTTLIGDKMSSIKNQIQPDAATLIKSAEAQKYFGMSLFEKISFEKFTNNLVDLPEFPHELEEIDEGFDSVLASEAPAENKSNEKLKEMFKNPPEKKKKEEGNEGQVKK